MGYIDRMDRKKPPITKVLSPNKSDFRPSDNLRIALNIAPNYTVSKNMPDGDFISPQGGSLLLMPPIIPVRMPDGNIWGFPEVSRQFCNPDGQPPSDH